MISCIRYVCLVILWAFSICESVCQKTYYYKFVVNTNANSKVAGGQFITFIGDICFESDINGLSVRNGKLSRNAYQSTNAQIVYEGVAFCGDGAKLKFNADKSKLKIVSKDGKNYSLVKTNPPSNVTTCSFIRKRDYSGGDNYSPQSGQNYPINSNNYGSIWDSGNMGNSSKTNNRVNYAKPRSSQRHTCSLCHGNKRIVRDTWPSLYGTKDYQVKCNECGGYFMRSTGHVHIPCPNCRGKGYFETD